MKQFRGLEAQNAATGILTRWCGTLQDQRKESLEAARNLVIFLAYIF